MFRLLLCIFKLIIVLPCQLVDIGLVVLQSLQQECQCHVDHDHLGGHTTNTKRDFPVTATATKQCLPGDSKQPHKQAVTSR